MNHWLFDLDYTLYSSFDISEKNKNTYYKSFGKKPLLNKLIKELNGRKYIFSNGNYKHVNDVLTKMKLKSVFNKIATADEYKNELKPCIKCYKYVSHKFKLDHEKDNIYFFEDSLKNLQTAKKLNWITILINPNKNKFKNYKDVDYIFPNIESAIFHFTKK